MAGGRDPHRDAGWRRASQAMGVTRVARLTGLDRTGVEVASAIRPRGHVLQVTNGKGDRFAEAAAGAVMEAAELFAAENAVIEAWDSAEALAARLGGEAVVSPAALEPEAAEPGWNGTRLAWRSGVDLASGARVLVPSHAVHVPPAGDRPLGPALVRWTSNAMGAARDRTAALLHALLEAIERDQLARALPDAFTVREVGRRLLERRTLARAAPRAAALAEAIERRGLGVYLFDVGPAATSTPTSTPTATATPTAVIDLRLPCAAALIVDDRGIVPVAAGYACRLGRDEALRAALLEAAQSRATEIHGAREDVAFGDRHAAAALAGICARARARRSVARMPDARAGSAAEAVRLVLARLRRAGFRRAVAVDLAGPPGIAVVKALVPGLLVSELL